MNTSNIKTYPLSNTQRILIHRILTIMSKERVTTPYHTTAYKSLNQILKEEYYSESERAGLNSIRNVYWNKLMDRYYSM